MPGREDAPGQVKRHGERFISIASWDQGAIAVTASGEVWGNLKTPPPGEWFFFASSPPGAQIMQAAPTTTGQLLVLDSVGGTWRWSGREWIPENTRLS